MSCHGCPYAQQCIINGGELDLGCEELEFFKSELFDDEELDGALYNDEDETRWPDMPHYRVNIRW